MVQLRLPENSRIKAGNVYKADKPSPTVKTFQIYRWNPDDPDNPKLLSRLRGRNFIAKAGKGLSAILLSLLNTYEEKRPHSEMAVSHPILE